MVKISELIEKLEQIKVKHGDLMVLGEMSGYGGHAIHTVTECVEVSNINLYDMLDHSCENEIKEIFPEWDGDIDTEQDLSVDYVEISLGGMLYST